MLFICRIFVIAILGLGVYAYAEGDSKTETKTEGKTESKSDDLKTQYKEMKEKLRATSKEMSKSKYNYLRKARKEDPKLKELLQKKENIEKEITDYISSQNPDYAVKKKEYDEINLKLQQLREQMAKSKKNKGNKE